MFESWIRYTIILSVGVTIFSLALAGFLLYRAHDWSPGNWGSGRVHDGLRLTAEVLSIRQAGLLVNQMPIMRLQLRVRQSGLDRELTIEQLIDLGNIPRVGEWVDILIDRDDPLRAVYLGPARRQTNTGERRQP
ncbi:hypothetical protein CXB49_09425 [Chromobacterium sp. ATCC 53434]|uniref:hypothetical protein n=1 Tax=Chromobacterium TaxID=535 RepID=UPI000C781CB3|nr:hypothetical protein [Chromobacterium sp. ATCC 53434]AUH51016.1 hypothetical protein CXB49_09425 [Chromobacterium sp. ATCC 53434]